MRILFVSQYFPPEMGAPAARVHELARRWVRCGEEVTVLTAFAHHPTGVKALGDRRRLSRRERVDGIDLLRAYVWATPNEGVAKRMLSFLTFMVAAIVVGLLRTGRPDVVVATSPQLLCACAGYVLARCKRAPFVLEVRDLWPESILAVGAMGDNLMVRLLKRVARFLYESSDRVVTVGEGYRREIHRLYGLPLQAMAVVPNGIDPELFRPESEAAGGGDRQKLRRQMGWEGRFVVMYLGTLGMAHGLEKVLEAARLLQAEDPRFHFVFVGEGADKARLAALAASWKAHNVEFVDQQPKARVPAFYAACDVGLVTLRDRPLFRAVLPSKIFEIMASSRPILITVAGEAREVVERSGGGVWVPPEDAPAMVEALQRLAADGVDLAAMGGAGREFVVEHFNREIQADRYLSLLRETAGQATPDHRGGPAETGPPPRT